MQMGPARVLFPQQNHKK